jgi:RimJ/RimL family protein N-acetyltransferase
VGVELRAATAADAERIAEILLTSREAFLPYARSPHTDDETRAWVRNTLLASQGVTIAVTDGKIVGVLAVDRVHSVSWITQLYLDPAHVGRGIGSRLLAQAMATTARPLRAYTFQQNAGARRFYERHGFAPIAFGDGSANEERCPDVLYELSE